MYIEVVEDELFYWCPSDMAILVVDVVLETECSPTTILKCDFASER